MSIIVFSLARQAIPVSFPGVAHVDDADSQIVIHPQAALSSTMHLYAMEIISTSGILPDASGNTTVRASLSSLGSGIDATITQAQRRSPSVSSASPGLEFTAGDPIYIHRPVANGGHSDIQVLLHIRMG